MSGVADPITAIGDWMIRCLQERIDCSQAGECVHDHINGACEYAPDGDA